MQLTCGGEQEGGTYIKTCYFLENNKWTEEEAFSEAMVPRLNPFRMSTGTYLFGDKTSRFMRRGSSKWLMGPEPHPLGTFASTCVTKISEEELLTIGGKPTEEYGKKVFKYNVQKNTWSQMHDLKTARHSHACALFQDEQSKYVLVAGGRETNKTKVANADTQIYFLNGTVSEGKSMTRARAYFSMAFFQDPEPKIYAIGGWTDGKVRLDDIEVWDSTQAWSYSGTKLKTKRNGYGIVSVPKSMLPFC